MDPPYLLDERSRPDLRSVYGALAARSRGLDAAVARVRLAGMTLESRELARMIRVRLVLAEMNALALSFDADAVASDPARRHRLLMLEALLRRETLRVRLAPLAGWTPDFTIFSGAVRPAGGEDPHTLILGPHWFERPFPHPGPALNAVLTGEAVLLAADRFERLWERGHDVSVPVQSAISEALRRSGSTLDAELTLRTESGYSFRAGGSEAGSNPV